MDEFVADLVSVVVVSAGARVGLADVKLDAGEVDGVPVESAAALRAFNDLDFVVAVVMVAVTVIARSSITDKVVSESTARLAESGVRNADLGLDADEVDGIPVESAAALRASKDLDFVVVVAVTVVVGGGVAAEVVSESLARSAESGVRNADLGLDADEVDRVPVESAATLRASKDLNFVVVVAVAAVAAVTADVVRAVSRASLDFTDFDADEMDGVPVESAAAFRASKDLDFVVVVAVAVAVVWSGSCNGN